MSAPVVSAGTPDPGRAPAAAAVARRRARRDAILDAAARLFNRRGLRGATLAEVAAEVGLATNSIAYYFRHKDDLAVACLLQAIESVVAVIVQAQRAPTVDARVAAFLHGYVDLLAGIESGAQVELVRFHDIRALVPAQRARVVEAYVPMFHQARALLGARDDDLARRRALNARTLLLLTMAFWTRAWIRRYELADYPLIARRMADIVLDGLAGRDARWADVPRWQGPSPIADPAADATREPFLHAATLLLNEQGYRGTSVDAISGRLNLTKGAFYHHHSDKDELIAACFARTFATIRRAQALAAGQPDGWHRLVHAAGTLACHQLSPSGPLLRLTSRSALPEAMRGETLRTMNRLTQHYGHFVVDGIADGSIRPVDPSIAADLVTGAVNAVVELAYWVPGFTVDEALDCYLRPLFVGLRAGVTRP